MGESYNQLDLDNRIELSRLLEDGKAQSEIAQIMGRHRSTIKRELERKNCRKAGTNQEARIEWPSFGDKDCLDWSA